MFAHIKSQYADSHELIHNSDSMICLRHQLEIYIKMSAGKDNEQKLPHRYFIVASQMH